ncbi:hypothetical protein BDF19DRAFT_25991 [Syncephalis fuscata]|nr:hypothetical protein BDF19DRAFT_25991 [Syncephalis fuscata]
METKLPAYSKTELARIETLEKEESKVIKLKTNILVSGLFASQEMPDNTALPLPLFHGEALLKTSVPFKLPLTLASAVATSSSKSSSKSTSSKATCDKQQSTINRKLIPRLFQTWLAAQPPLLTENVYSKKTFWDCGIYGTCARPLVDDVVPFPLPIHSGAELLDETLEQEFQLPGIFGLLQMRDYLYAIENRHHLSRYVATATRKE